MAKTARDLVIASLQTSGAIASNENPNANEIVHGLNELNGLMDQLDLDSLFPYTNSQMVIATEAGKSTYTVGLLQDPRDVSRIESTVAGTVRVLSSPVPHVLTPGDVFYLKGSTNVPDGRYTVSSTPQNTAFEFLYDSPLFDENPSVAVFAYDVNVPDYVTARPNRLISCGYSESDVYRPMVELTSNDFYNKTIQGASGTPGYFLYESTFPWGEVKVYPTPGAGTMLLRYQFKVEEYTLDDEISLPPGYYGTLQYQLAAILAIHYGIQAPAIYNEARKRLARIKRLNSSNKKNLINDFGRGRGHYNGLTDTWSR